MLDDEINEKYVYYDKELEALDKFITSAYNSLKKIKERNDLKECITVSKSIFDRRILDKYSSNHPNMLYHLQIGDVSMLAVKDSQKYKVNLIGYNETLLGFQIVDTVGYQTSIRSVTFDQLSDFFSDCVRKLLNKENVPNELF